MAGNIYINNYDFAKAESDKVDKEIIDTLQKGESFRVEAGAGSGKTYSLNKVIEWIQNNKLSEYVQKNKMWFVSLIPMLRLM